MPPTLPPPTFWDANGDKILVSVITAVIVLLFSEPIKALLKRLGGWLERSLEAAGFGFEKRYLKALGGQHQWLKLIGIYNRADLNPPRLQNVFISLRLAARAAAEDGPRFGWEKMLDEHKAPIVILGHPGAGKTTLLDYLTLVFSGHIPHPLRKTLGAPLPLFARLRDLGGQNTPTLLETLQSENSTGLNRIPNGYFERRLRRQSCIVLLDGLDEVIDPAAHDRAVAEIQRFANEYPGNRLVVTCRVAGWHNQLPGWCVYQVQDCNADDVQRFVSAWYREVLRAQEVNLLGPQPLADAVAEAERRAYAAAQIETGRLWDALRKNEGLLRIARTPLILSLITLVHKTRADLPKGRARLYHECLEILLEKWDMENKRLNQPDAPSLKDKLLALHHIAVTFLRRGVVEMEERGLEALLVPLLASMTRPMSGHDLLRQIVERSGVLVETRIGVYGFAHRALADQLAASLVVEQGADSELISHAAEERWREVILIAAGLVSPARAEQLVSALLAQGGDSPASLAVAGWSLVEDIQVSAELRKRVKTGLLNGLNQTPDPAGFTLLAEALLAADAGSAAGWVSDILAGQDDRLRQRTLTLLTELSPEAGQGFAPILIRLLENDHETPATRARAALALPKLVTQPDAALWQALQSARQPSADTLLKSAATWAWCEMGRFAELGLVKVPAGEFLMGSDSRVDSEAMDREQPQHSRYLPAFYIAKSPITVAKWCAYGDVSGCEPEDPQSLEGSKSHPVRFVSWTESLAYAQWYGFNLPSEAEWEKAARGVDGRIYPWGSVWGVRLANTVEYWERDPRGFASRIFRRNFNSGPTPVGQFSPAGDSPYYCADMAGNVWEWTRSEFKPYPYDPQDGREELQSSASRVLRGGAFNYSRGNVRCAYRDNLPSDNFHNCTGFRVAVVSPIFHL